MTLVFNRIKDRTKRRQLRSIPSSPEAILWSRLRARQVNGLKFRRQYSIGRYVADFYCALAKLVIELDGDSHFTDEAEQYDRQRDAYMESLGLKILRFTNKDIQENLESVLEKIVAECTLLLTKEKGWG